MDLRDLAAGVICVGFEGTVVDEALGRRLRELPVAGLILFARNIESLSQTRALTDAIRTCFTGVPPIVAIDQEGGRVARLREGVEEFPPMMAVAATEQTELARRAGEQLGFDLRRAGVNVDFAPVLDLAIFDMNTVIGARSFGNDPQTVTLFAGAFAEGLRAQGVVPTFKHFPGHGSTAVDSHLDLPVIDLDNSTLRGRDLLPFVNLLPDAQALMTAHIIVRAFDREQPATTSRPVLTALLRDEIGFKGVCFTDCMQMDAIAKGIGSAQGAVQALAAGADCVLISHSWDVAAQSASAIVAAVEAGTLARERVQEAYDRVQALRAQLQPPLPVQAAPPHPGIGREIGRRAVTLLHGKAHADPSRSIVVSFEGMTVEGVQGAHSLHASLGTDFHLDTFTLPLEPQAAPVRDLIARLETLNRQVIVLARRAHIYDKQRVAIEMLLAAFRDAILVSVREPYDALAFSSAANVLCTYGDDSASLNGLSDVLFRGEAVQGHLPLTMGTPLA